MMAALLLLAAALSIAPWTTPAGARLTQLTELTELTELTGGRVASRVSGRSGAPGSPGQARRGHPAALAIARVAVVLTGLRARWGGRAGTPADPGTLAQMLDLLAVSLLAGLPTPDALAAVADAVEHSDTELARPLRATAARMRLGATPVQAWSDVPGGTRLAPVNAVLVRACDGGGSVRSALEHASRRLRSEADSAATARAERAAVMVAGPLGLCFLPAFVCLGVLPVVVGLADGMLPGVLP